MINALLLCLSLGCQGTQKPWTPPQTKLPKEFAECTSFVLERGFADPRGGKFSKATVTSYNSWDGGGKPIEVEGWLMPETNGKKRQIVLPNGLSYDVLSVLGDADVNNLKPKTNAPPVFDGFQTTYSKVATLLLAGETSLAEAVYESRSRSGEQQVFVNLSNAYLIARFHRAVEAHMQGDDKQALADAQALQAVRQDFETEAQSMMDKRLLEAQAEYNPGKKMMAFPYLYPLDDLIQDTKRRIQEGPKKSLDFEALKKMPQSERIAKLIENLDEVSARKWAQPGSMNVGGDEIVSALVQEGEAAVEPLIEVAEKDKRLTRSVSFGRDFFPPRDLIPVKQIAIYVIGQVYQANVFIEKEDGIDLQALRAYAAKNKGLTPAERWYATLQDDSAGRDKWVAAAAQLVNSPAVRNVGDGWQTVAPQADRTMNGEPLRGRTPSISSLMDKRARELIPVGEPASSHISFDMSDALLICLALHKWDPKAALPTMKAVSDGVMKPYGSLQGYVARQCTKRLGEVTLVRMQLGDKTALEPFGEWLMAMDIDDTGRDIVRGLIPIAAQPEDPQIEALAKRLFTTPTSPWNLLDIQKRNTLQKAENVILSPLLADKTVASTAEELLKNKTVVGETWWEGNNVHYRVKDGASGSLGVDDKEDPLRPKHGAKMDLRVCDKIAMALSRLKGAPKFRPYWPVAEKDKAIPQLAAYIKANRSRINELLPWPANWSSPRR